MPMPYRIETPRLVIRCYDPRDAALLKQAVDESLEHLRPWMPWAQYEPTSLADKVQRLRLMRGNFDLDSDYTVGVFNPDETRLLGGAGLHKRHEPGALEIGYWIHAGHTGQGYASEVAAALTQVAFGCLDSHRVEIRCDPNNLASQAVPRKLGYMHEATLQRRETTTDGHPRDTMIWTMFQTDNQAEPSELMLYDSTGTAIISRGL
jgi:RimJ/RimL family protein N-acetyltransferase